MRLAVSLAASIAFAVAACGDDTTANDGDDTGGTTGTSEGESSTTTSAADDAVDSSGVAPTSASEGAAPPALEYARGIRLSRLIANQAVQVELVVDGVTVDPATHTSRLVSGRRTLVRAFWSLHAGFEPRELVGRLIVGYPDGSELVDDRVEMVDGESIDKGPSFQWLLDPDDVQAGMTLRVQALEPDVAAASGEVSDPPPILPYESALALPVHEAVLEMKVVLIPVLHQLDGCEQVPVPTEEDVAAIAAQLEQNNALQSAMVTVGEPMPYTDPIGGQDNGFSPVLTALAMQRETDAPDPNVYYYGLLMPCDGFPPGLLGQAIGIPPSPTKELAYQRVSTGRWQGTGAATAETLVHEVGHTQGRRHVLCSGGEGGPDPSYPHENGRIGVWGFGIHDFQLRAPTSARDYMTYCANEWVSDYGWEQTLDVIETLTSWDFEDGGESSRDGVLVGAIHADGSSTWWTARGAPPATSSDARVVWTIEGLEVVRAAHAEPMPDGTATLVVAPLPSGHADATALRFESAGAAPRSIAPASVRLVYRPRD